jgi:SAM-dependent methyltransferase
MGASSQPLTTTAKSIDYDDWDTHWAGYAAAAEHSPAQIYRRRLMLRLLDRRQRPGRIVDLGCGPGDFLYDATRRWPDAKLLGLEMSARGVTLSRQKVPHAEVMQADLIADDGSHDGRFTEWATHAVCSEVLEHVDDPSTLLRNARRYLQPGAMLVVTVPGGSISAFDRHIGHRRHYTPELLADTFAEAGLVTDRVDGAGFPAFNLYRWFVLKRGERVISDVLADDGGLTLSARLAMMAFNPLLAVSLTRSPWGRQIVGIAYEPVRPVPARGRPPG